MRTFVTGGTGFIGGAVVRRLLEAGHEVKALVRPGADTRQLDGLPVERVEGDLRDRESLRRGMAGCGWVFHVAALYSYWGYRWNDFYQANVEGTRQVLEVARQEGIERVVYTSSIAALGVHKDGSPATEDTPSTLADRIGPYQRSKFLAEEVARNFARQGLPVVIVNPSSPVGIGDHKPTPTGQIIVDFLNGRIFGYVDTGLNIIDVEDVAAGHLLAAERGQVGRAIHPGWRKPHTQANPRPARRSFRKAPGAPPHSTLGGAVLGLRRRDYGEVEPPPHTCGHSG